MGVGQGLKGLCGRRISTPALVLGLRCHSCPSDLQDELARVLVTLFDSRHLLYQLLWNMFSKEVELADSMQTLFRGNSLASKIMTFCFKVRQTASVSGESADPLPLPDPVLHISSGVRRCVPSEAPGASAERSHHHPRTHQL